MEYSSWMTVKLIRHMADDNYVVQAAQVSVKGENNPDTDAPRLINYLASARHGSPFEHSVMTFYVEAPIFVFREFQRHRIASYNEMSGRYTEMQPKFYIPAEDRALVNVGSSARPKFAPGSFEQTMAVTDEMTSMASMAWDSYQAMLENGIAKEVARMVLPLNIYSQMYVTINARSLMNFLSLRVGNQPAKYATSPQREIEMVAEHMEELFSSIMPQTHKAFVDGGRVAP